MGDFFYIHVVKVHFLLKLFVHNISMLFFCVDIKNMDFFVLLKMAVLSLGGICKNEWIHGVIQSEKKSK